MFLQFGHSSSAFKITNIFALLERGMMLLASLRLLY